MTDYMHTGLEVVARHVPDYSLERDQSGNNQQVELPGVVQFGVLVEGAFVPITSVKKDTLDTFVATAKQNQPQQVEQSTPTQQPTQSEPSGNPSGGDGSQQQGEPEPQQTGTGTGSQVPGQ